MTPKSLAIGDLNHDGRLDIVVASASSDFVSVFVGNGDGTFASPVNYHVGAGSLPFGVALGDLNGDGNADIVLADNGRLSVTILLGNGDATFHAGRIFAAGGEASAVALGDFNHDGKLDVAVANDTLLSTQPGNAAILLGDGKGGLRPPVTYEVGSEPSAIIATDLDSDGKLDLAVVNPKSSSLSILIGQGDGTFRTAVGYTAGAFRSRAGGRRSR